VCPRKSCNLINFMIKWLNLNRFKQNFKEIVLNNLVITTKNVIKKFSKLRKLIVKFLVLKIAISNVVIRKTDI